MLLVLKGLSGMPSDGPRGCWSYDVGSRRDGGMAEGWTACIDAASGPSR